MPYSRFDFYLFFKYYCICSSEYCCGFFVGGFLQFHYAVRADCIMWCVLMIYLVFFLCFLIQSYVHCLCGFVGVDERSTMGMLN